MRMEKLPSKIRNPWKQILWLIYKTLFSNKIWEDKHQNARNVCPTRSYIKDLNPVSSTTILCFPYQQLCLALKYYLVIRRAPYFTSHSLILINIVTYSFLSISLSFLQYLSTHSLQHILTIFTKLFGGSFPPRPAGKLARIFHIWNWTSDQLVYACTHAGNSLL